MFSAAFRKFLKIAWFLPGFLLWAAFPPMGERMDVLFALAPLLWLSRREPDVGTIVKRWLQSGLCYWLATLSWMPAIMKNGGPWPLVLLGWFALAAYCSLYFALFGWLVGHYWRWARGDLNAEGQRRRGRYGLRLVGVLVVEPILWCGLELVRSRLFGGFAWNQLGVVPINSGFGAPAAVGGVYLCSAVVVLINGTIAGIAERVWKPERSGFENLKRRGVFETLLAFALVFGIYRVSALASSRFSLFTFHSSLKVALVQRNFPCRFQEREESPVTIYRQLLENVAPLEPDLVVLSESAMHEFGLVDRMCAARFAKFVSDLTGAAVLAGGNREGDDGCLFNSAALYAFPPSVTNAQPSVSIYDKVHLVPFGEFIPGDKMFPILQKLAPVGSCTPGELKTIPLHLPSNTQTLKHSNISLGVAICYEDTDSAQMRALAAMGAQALVFITNDSWFSHSVEAEQHSWQVVARAIETGLPVVRVGNSGVTGSITPDGKATWLLGPDGRPLVDQRGTMLDRIEVKGRGQGQEQGQERTVYVRFGDWPLGIAFSLLVLFLILVKYRNRYEYSSQT